MSASHSPTALALAAILGTSIWGAVIAEAQGIAPPPSGFRTPTDNIHCELQDGRPGTAGQVVLRCDIGAITNRAPPKPRSCDLDWGTTFAIALEDRKAARLCAGDTVRDISKPILEYGAIWQQRGFSCVSERTGLTCFNVRRHGFTLSRPVQTLF